MRARQDRGQNQRVIIAAQFGTGQVFWSLVWLTMWLIWLWLLFIVFRAIIFRSDDPGWAKALWVLFVIVLPYLGVFVYLIAWAAHHRPEPESVDRRPPDAARDGVIVPGEHDVEAAAAELAERLPEPLVPLARVAYNYRWSWAPDGPACFGALDPERWARVGSNPGPHAPRDVPVRPGASRRRSRADSARRSPRRARRPRSDASRGPVAVG